jgi:proteic killer suppression protein
MPAQQIYLINFRRKVKVFSCMTNSKTALRIAATQDISYPRQGMILSFRVKRTRALFEGERVKAFQAFERQVMWRLDRVYAADRLLALNTPGNRPEGLQGNRKAITASASMNNGGSALNEGSPGPLNVEIVDYH